MKKQEQLFFLIKSLTKSEKRYFKRFATLNGNGDKAYLALFDFIDGQSEPGDNQIKDHFIGHAFLSQLHVMKNYLSSLIMKSLRCYNESKSKNSELKELLREVEILFEKELYDQCRSTIEKVIRLATKFERFESLIDAYRWKRQLLQATQGVIKARKEIREIIGLEQEVHRKLESISALLDLSYSMMENEFGERNDHILHHATMTNENARSSVQAFIHYNHIRYACYAFSGQLKEGLNALDNIVTLLEENPHRIKEDASSYITVLNNKIGALLHSKELSEIPKLLHTIRSAPIKYNIPPNRSRIKAFLSTYNVELEMYRDTGEWARGIQVINEIKSFLENNSKDVSAEHQITFYYQFAYIFFMAKDYSSALKYLNEIISSSFKEVRIDIATYARFLNLMIHFELRNIIVLRYSVDSCRRFLLKRRQPQKFEKVLLRFFSKISTRPQSQWSEQFSWLRENLFLKTSDGDKANILDYLNYNKWIDDNLKVEKKELV